MHYLDAILGKDGLLRVGGRLENAPINVDQRYPPILHGSHQITKLLIHHLHVTHHHAGPSTLMGILADNYYVLRARLAVRNVVRCCVICRRRNFKTIQQKMGQLPAARVTPAPPFSIVGVDFAGPITIRVGKVRKPTKLKAYISVFVCFVTKATHLEPVSDLSTRAFVAALRRFVARRGYPSDIYSDNGTNFVGTSRASQEVYKFLSLWSTQESVDCFCASKQTKWHHSPSCAPNFGGLWEAAVKSTKKILKDSLETSLLTFEELTTVLTQVEAVMNSRPLLPLETLPEDGVQPLTQSHFLMGKPTVSLPMEIALPQAMVESTSENC